MASLVPLNDAGALPLLHGAGVGQVYVGFHDDEWEGRFGAAELNRMSGFGREANPFGFAEMLAHVGRARDLGMRAFVCFNAPSYSPAQLDFIAGAYLPGIAEAGADGVIVANQALVASAREAGLGAVMSTVAGVFNARLAEYYRDLGATRLILPRDLSIDEVAGIMRAVPQVEYEVFLMRNGCMFSDSHCLGCHRAGEPSLCRSLREGDVDINEAPALSGLGAEAGLGVGSGAEPGDAPGSGDGFIERARRTEWLLNMRYHRRTCGLCALWRFEQLGVAAYKVVGRGDDVDDLVADAALVERNAAFARTCPSERDYHARMELPRDPATLCGMDGLSCYYPEARR